MDYKRREEIFAKDYDMLENKLLELGSFAETFKNDISERDGE